MSWFFKHYAKFFPERAMKGFIASQRIERLKDMDASQRSFDAIKGGRGYFNLKSETRSPDSAIYDNLPKLRGHIRQLEHNSGHISGPIKRNARNVVGRGIRFQSAVSADDLTKRHEFPIITEKTAAHAVHTFEKGFAKWNAQADVRLLHSFYEQQSIAESALMRDGECLVIGRESNRRGRIVSYATEVLEADRLMNPINEIHNPKIRHGIEYDDEGAPAYYHILKVHPGETSLHALKNPRWETDQVPAYFKTPGDGKLKKVLHLYNPVRPEQTRGFSDFISGLKDLHDIDRVVEAEKLAILEDACMTGVVTTTDPTGFASGYTQSSGDEKYERINEFAPNKWHYFRPGEEVDIHSPKRPNTALIGFLDFLVRGPANAIDMPPEVYSQNWQGMNYSNARTVLLNFYGASWMRQWYLINHLCLPVAENVLTRLVIKGKAIAPGFDRRRDDYLSCTWIPAVYRKWIDPKKEADGKKIDLDTFVEALPDILAEQGKDEDEHLEKIARTRVKVKKLEEKYDIKMKETAPQPSKTEEIEDEIEEIKDEKDEKSAVLSVV